MAETRKKNEEIQENVEPVEEEMVNIRLPLTKELQSDVFVRVNERTWLIKRGQTVTVPKCVVEVLEHAEEAEMYAMNYQMSKEQKQD